MQFTYNHFWSDKLKLFLCLLLFCNLVVTSAQAYSFVPKTFDPSFKGNKTLSSYQAAKKQMVKNI